MSTRRLIILGSTGSIGVQALDVVGHVNRLHEAGRSPLRFEVVGLAAGTGSARLAEQAVACGARQVAIADGGSEVDVPGVEVRRGADASERLVREVDCDVVLSAIVGAAGLPATMAAVELGRDVAIANKETLVAAGELVVAAARRTGAHLLPVDSEHAAAWQCLACVCGGAVPPFAETPPIERLVLTASGGPFRERALAECYHATPAEALDHPTWRMGPKNTIDSASMMNKALELVEAHHLFALPADRLGVLIQAQSVVHALVELADRSVVAQLAAPDMRLPIQQALTHPHRLESPIAPADLHAVEGLHFDEPDPARWPALELAFRAIEMGGAAGAVMNAANEAAVEAFLSRSASSIPFGRIPEVVGEAMEALGSGPLGSVGDALEAGERARVWVRRRIAGIG